MQLRLLERRALQSFSPPRNSCVRTTRSSSGFPQRTRPSFPFTTGRKPFTCSASSNKSSVSCSCGPMHGFFEISGSTTTIPAPIFKVSDFEKMEYRKDVLNVHTAVQTIHFGDPNHVRKPRIMVREGRWLKAVGLFSVEEKKPSSNRLSLLPTAVFGKVLVPNYLFDGFHRRAVSKTVEHY